MAYETLVLTREERFAIITLNRPPANAISETLMRELNAALSDLDHMLSEALANALDALPEDARNIVHAKYFDELPIGRIAEHLNLTEKAVERKLARARARLRRDIQQQLASSSQ